MSKNFSSITLKIYLKCGSGVSSMIGFGGLLSNFDHLKDVLKLLRISISSMGMKGKGKLWENKNLIFHPFLLSMLVSSCY